ncbi:DUF3817 domain-containing protein [Arthrobacter deserti]|uniref:DUF3817 domain-containing protein n=1 Tax=Arthrobacter deserti TaxID=1742687 RepID=A0ABX1JMX4_9MICC|nr:DUF3817 domain-containing protein [Arthrobacter deserti]
MSPRTLFRPGALAEAATWTLLLAGLLLKYVVQSTDLGVRIGGALHGFVFLCYVAVTCFTWVNQQWPARAGLSALASAVVPYASIAVERSLDRRGMLGGGQEPHGALEKAQAWALAHPVPPAVILFAAVAAVFGFLLFLGPPGTWFA